jgi:uncharacterized protein YbjT (DUF2867 family)
MYAILGITGNVGGATARALLKAGKKVRGIVRDKARASGWQAAGAELAVADVHDVGSLEKAMLDVAGAFIMIPPNFAPKPGYPETKAIVATLRQAVATAKPPKAVYLSSVGAQHDHGLGLITQLHILEQELGSLPVPNAFIRAAWVMENFQWDIASAQEKARIDSYLSPLNRAIPMVATDDIGRQAAACLQQQWQGNRYVEIEGPRRYSPSDAAIVFSRHLKREVQATTVPRERWTALFEQEGMPSDCTKPRIEMLDGFNSGFIDFAKEGTEHVSGKTTLDELLGDLLKKH